MQRLYFQIFVDLSFFFVDHVHDICETYFIQVNVLRQVRQCLTDEAAILVANALVSNCLD